MSPQPPHGRDPLARGLSALRTRWTRVRGLGLGLQVLFHATLAAVAVALVLPAADPALLVGALVLAAGAAGAAGALLTRPTEAALAKELDDRAGLADRLSSAVELRGRSGPMVEALREDARAAAARLVPAEVIPLRVPREGYWLPVPLLLLAGALAFDGGWGAEDAVDPALEETLERRMAALEELVSGQERAVDDARRKGLREELQRLTLRLQPEDVDKKDALEEVARLREQLERQRAAERDEERRLEELLDELKPGERDSELAEALDAGDHSAALDRLHELQEELRRRLDEERAALSDEELAALEERLAQLETIEAHLLSLLQMDADLALVGEVLGFLEDFEAELAELEDPGARVVLRLEDLEPAPP